MASITLGCDPEFGFLNDKGQIVYPGGVIVNQNGAKFGIDGSTRVAELRPDFSTTPQGLVDNIKAILQKGITENPDTIKYKWKAGSVVGEEAIGGHIHLGHDILRNSTGRKTMAKALSRIVSPLALMVEDKVEAVDRRVGTQYGHCGEGGCWREQGHGMEYRSLCSWLMGPKEALSILALTFVVGSECDNKKWLEEAATLPEVDHEHFQDCDKRVISFYLVEIAKVLRKASLFKKYQEPMGYLFDHIYKGKTFNHDQDMKKSWGLSYTQVRETVGATR